LNWASFTAGCIVGGVATFLLLCALFSLAYMRGYFGELKLLEEEG